MSKLVKFIFEEHKLISITRAAKTIDPRYMTINAKDEETFTLRLGLQNYDDDVFFYLWDQQFLPHGETANPLFTEDNLRVIVEFALFQKMNAEFFHRFLQSPMT